jgi:hypothetical protein
MAHTKVTINSPNSFITALSQFAVTCGWHVLVEGNDLPIDGAGVTDGKRLVIKSPGGGTFAHFRAANGKDIFPTVPVVTPPGGIPPAPLYKYGVGLTCSTAFTETPPSGLWYDQIGVTRNVAQEIIGVGIPLLQSAECTVYFNHIAEPAELIIASIELYPGFFQHIAVGEVYKIGAWTGETVFSASCSSAKMFPTSIEQGFVDANSCQLFASNVDANTFLHVNIDAAPLRTPEVIWASSGTLTGKGYTGKRLAFPVVHKNALAAHPKIPHYGYLQSQTPSDYGRNVNTLNCISVNLPLAVYVLRDPNGLENYSQCGYIPGTYYISTRNVAPASVYNVDYPSSGDTYQAFPHTTRGGTMGYDGFSIRQ